LRRADLTWFERLGVRGTSTACLYRYLQTQRYNALRAALCPLFLPRVTACAAEPSTTATGGLRASGQQDDGAWRLA